MFRKKIVRRVQAQRSILQCSYLLSVVPLVSCGSPELEVPVLCLLYALWTLFLAQLDRTLCIRNKVC